MEKTDKQLLLAEHKKANDALRELKDLYRAGKLGILLKTSIYFKFNAGELDEMHREALVKIDTNLEQLSNYLRQQFEAIMKSNKKIKTIEYKPLHTKNLTDKKQKINSVHKGKTMAVKKKAPVKKPAAKPMKKGKK